LDTTTSILLGVLQGLTEFLPVSSSGHLVLMQNLFGLREPELLFDTTLHVGALVAVIIYFRLDLKAMVRETCRFASDLRAGRRGWMEMRQNPHTSLRLWTVLGSVPTAIMGLVRKGRIFFFAPYCWAIGLLALLYH